VSIVERVGFFTAVQHSPSCRIQSQALESIHTSLIVPPPSQMALAGFVGGPKGRAYLEKHLAEALLLLLLLTLAVLQHIISHLLVALGALS